VQLPTDKRPRTQLREIGEWYVRAPPNTSIRMAEQDHTPSEPAAVPGSDDPPAEVAKALATLMALAATLDELELDGVEPMFIPRESA
jgi:hypothetical protein